MFSESLMLIHRHSLFVIIQFLSLFLLLQSTETSDEPLVDLADVLNSDADILGMLGKSSSESGASFYLTGSHSSNYPKTTSFFIQQIASLLHTVTHLIDFLFKLHSLKILLFILGYVCQTPFLCLVCFSLFYFTHFIWFWVLVGLDFCSFQVDSSPPPFGKGDKAN